MDEREWTFTAGITHPDGTDVYVSMTVPQSTANSFPAAEMGRLSGVLECSELAQMGAIRAMGAYVATKNANASKAPF